MVVIFFSFRIYWPTFSFYKQVIYVWFAKGKQYISASNPPRIPPQTDKWTADQSSCTMHVYFECPFGWPFLLPRLIDYQISSTTKNAKFDNTAYLPTIDKSRTLYITYWEKNRIILYYYYYYITSISAIKLPFYYYMYVACCIALFSGKVSSLLLPLLLT